MHNPAFTLTVTRAGLFFAGSAVVQVPSVLAGAYVGPPQWLTFLLVAWWRPALSGAAGSCLTLTYKFDAFDYVPQGRSVCRHSGHPQRGIVLCCAHATGRL